MHEEYLIKKYFEYEKKWDCDFLIEFYGSEIDAYKTFTDYFLNMPNKIIENLIEDVGFIRNKLTKKKNKENETRLLEVFELLAEVQKIILRDYENK